MEGEGRDSYGSMSGVPNTSTMLVIVIMDPHMHCMKERTLAVTVAKCEWDKLCGSELNVRAKRTEKRRKYSITLAVQSTSDVESI